LEEYLMSVPAAGRTTEGKALFVQHCSSCHVLEGQGHAVGPDLRSVVPGKTRADILTAVLDPNREVDPRFVEYVANVADGRVVTGLVMAESATGVTLKKADGVEVVVKRTELDEFRSTGQSLMPEGLEKGLTPAQMADLLEYLRQATKGQ
jgi:putative heme-binding domain-containing protein